MDWVLGTPWVMLLAMLVFTAEAWASEHCGGLKLELPMSQIANFAAPPWVDVVVTLRDGEEVLCGSLGELCIRVIAALGMAILPAWDSSRMNAALAPVVAELLRAGVWCWRADMRSYIIGHAFGDDCYGKKGHHIRLSADGLYQALRGVCIAWARERLER